MRGSSSKKASAGGPSGHSRLQPQQQEDGRGDSTRVSGLRHGSPPPIGSKRKRSGETSSNSSTEDIFAAGSPPSLTYVNAPTARMSNGIETPEQRLPLSTARPGRGSDLSVTSPYGSSVEATMNVEGRESHRTAKPFYRRDILHDSTASSGGSSYGGPHISADPVTSGGNNISCKRKATELINGADFLSPSSEGRSPKRHQVVSERRLSISYSDLGTFDGELLHQTSIVDALPVDLALHVISFLVESQDMDALPSVCRKWRSLCRSQSIWKHVSSVSKDGGVNWKNFENLGIKNKGTEGICFKVRERSTGRILAMKRARVYPEGEGVPYYMLRELAVLEGMDHPNIASLRMINLSKNKLHVFFPFVEHTLHDTVNPKNDPNGGIILPEVEARHLLHQLLDAIAYCHRRGVLHRNLKPKHLLIEKADGQRRENATLKVSDFALVRATGFPRRTYTTEVVTLWYRPPEILMGMCGYTPAVDMWSIGCIFAEMAQGKPLFTGISEVDQLFQIFSKLSTPTAETWPGFKKLPNYNFTFPNWGPRPLQRLFSSLSPMALDLLQSMLRYDPEKRITAEDALRHPFFTSPNAIYKPLKPVIEMAMVRPKDMTSQAEYVGLFHGYLRHSERQFFPLPRSLSKQKSLTADHRSMLVDWLIEVVDVFEMCIRTAFLAVSYTDRFLATVVVPKKKFQLLGATCLHVASKCEDVSYIGVEDLAMCADNVYKAADVLEMEELLLNVLNFQLAVPTVLDFVFIFQERLPPLQEKVKFLSQVFARGLEVTTYLKSQEFVSRPFLSPQYISELVLQEHQFLQYLPSLVAISILSLSMYCVEGTCWTPEMEEASGYTWNDLEECMKALQFMYSSSALHSLAVIRKRYSKPERHQVANLAPPVTYNMRWDSCNTSEVA